MAALNELTVRQVRCLWMEAITRLRVTFGSTQKTLPPGEFRFLCDTAVH